MSTPADPRIVTFDLLAKHKSAEAESVLLKAFESEDEESRQLAAATVFKRPGQNSLLKIICCVDSLDDKACEEFSLSPERFDVALDQCLRNTDDDTRRAAVEFIRRTANFTQFSALLTQLRTDNEELRKAVTVAIGDLTDQLSQRLRTGDESVLPTFDLESLQAHRQLIMAHLASQKKSSALDEHVLYPILRSVLLLGRADEEAVLNVLSRRGSVYRAAATRILSEESNPAAFVLLCESLTRNSPSSAIFEAFSVREDFEFVLHFLDWLPATPTGYLKNNLKRLSELHWLDYETSAVSRLPPNVHDRLVALANLVPMNDVSRLELKTWIVRQSGAEGRAAASDVLNSLPPETVRAILQEALEDKDPEVEAWATHQLRSQKLPETFEALVTRLDNQLTPVCDAARDELFSFDLQRFLELFPNLSPAQCAQCGQALMKINPDTPSDLSKELTHPFRWRRIRAIRATQALGLIQEVQSDVIHALSDSEASVRCMVIETLGKHPSRASIEAIRGMTDDDSRTVRDTANRLLVKLAEKLTTAQRDLATQAAP